MQLLYKKQMFELRSKYEDRHIAKNAGFFWNPTRKVWYTDSVKTAINLKQYADTATLQKIKELQEEQRKKIKESKATTTNISIPCKKGLSYFPFQEAGIAYALSRKNCLIADEMGLGKTIQTIGFINASPKIKKILIICPASLKINWKKELQKWLVNNHSIEILDGKSQPSASDITIINYDIVKKHCSWLYKIKWDLLIADECFPKGTKIKTLKGEKNIEDIKVGDKIYNATGIGVVTHLGRRYTKNLIKLHLSNGKSIKVTPLHPIFTDKGWLFAKDCKNKRVFTSSNIFNIMNIDIILKKEKVKYEKIEKFNMQGMQKRISKPFQKNVLYKKMCSNQYIKTPRSKKENISSRYKTYNRKGLLNLQKNIQDYSKQGNYQKKVLRNILLGKMENGATRNQNKMQFSRMQKKIFIKYEKSTFEKSRMGKESIRENEKKQSYQKSRNCSKNKKNMEINGRSSFKTSTNKRREWKRFALCPENSLGSIRIKMENRIPNKNKNEKWYRLSNMLQSRYSFTKRKNLDRSRWLEPFVKNTKRKRQEKRNVLENIRVERIENIEQRSGKKSSTNFTKNTKGIEVFNLEVSNHPSYFANDILVHNCHYLKNPKSLRSKYIFGKSGTMPGITAERKIYLTGTPVLSRPIELFTILNNAKIFTNWYGYAKRFCAGRKTKYGWDVTGSSNTTELQNILREKIMIRRLKKDVLPDLPAKNRQIIELPAEGCLKLIRKEQTLLQQKENILTELKAKVKTTKINKNKNEYMQAVMELKNAARTAFMEIEKIRQEVAIAKTPYIIEHVSNMIEQGIQSIIIFAHHLLVIEKLHNAFKNNSVIFTGRTKTKDREKIISLFQTGKKNIFIGSIRAAGVGLTLTRSANVIFAEQDWTPSIMQQAEDRAHRIGQKNSILIQYIVLEGSIDATMAKTIIKKQKVIDKIVNTL